MKQTFVIEHDVPRKLHGDDIIECLTEIGFARAKFTVTEITETEKNVDCHSCEVSDCVYCEITESERCKWKSWADHDGDIIYSTSCKNEHKFFCDGPEENRYTTCPYCGKPIEVSE